MILRTLVETWLRNAAREQILGAAREAVSNASDEASGDAASEGPPPPCQVGIVFALGIEAGGLVDKLADSRFARRGGLAERAGWINQRRVVIVESGVGRAAAARATEQLLRAHQPSWIISAGFAGALVPELRRGHVLMADEVIDLDGNRLAVVLDVDRESVAATPSLHVGRLLTVDEILRTEDRKREVGESHQALACDMETIAVAEVCRERGIGCLSVRIISDALEDELPAEIEKLLDQKSWASKLGAAAGAVFRRPSSVKDMWRLQEDALKASDRLARFLEGVITQLAPPSYAPPADSADDSPGE
jgi:adenosylhomocysteine nucleosidase